MKVPTHEFTTAEIVDALRPIVPEAEAHRMAEFLTKPVDVDEVLARRPHNRNGPGLSYLDIPTVNFSGDILILLSLLSLKPRRRSIDIKPRCVTLGPSTAMPKKGWERRRRELKAWRDAGFPRNDADDEPAR